MSPGDFAGEDQLQSGIEAVRHRRPAAQPGVLKDQHAPLSLLGRNQASGFLDPRPHRIPSPQVRLARRVGRRSDEVVQHLPKRRAVRLADFVVERLALGGDAGLQYGGHRLSGSGLDSRFSAKRVHAATLAGVVAIQTGTRASPCTLCPRVSGLMPTFTREDWGCHSLHESSSILPRPRMVRIRVFYIFIINTVTTMCMCAHLYVGFGPLSCPRSRWAQLWLTLIVGRPVISAEEPHRIATEEEWHDGRATVGRNRRLLP